MATEQLTMVLVGVVAGQMGPAASVPLVKSCCTGRKTRHQPHFHPRPFRPTECNADYEPTADGQNCTRGSACASFPPVSICSPLFVAFVCFLAVRHFPWAESMGVLHRWPAMGCFVRQLWHWTLSPTMISRGRGCGRGWYKLAFGGLTAALAGCILPSIQPPMGSS